MIFPFRKTRHVIPVEPDFQTEEGREAHRLVRGEGEVPDTGTALARLAQLVIHMPVADCVAAGLLSTPDDLQHTGVHGGRPGRGVRHGRLSLALSSDRRHQALEWLPEDERHCRLWVDGRVVDVPREARVDVDETSPVAAEGPGRWLGDRVYLLELVPGHHPLQDWTNPFNRGEQFGLLVVDAATGRRHMEMPGPEESWPDPKARLEDGVLLLFPNGAALDAGQPCRRILLDPPAGG